MTLGIYSLMPLVTRYLRAHPEVQVDLTLSDRLVDPVEEGYEAVIRLGPVADTALVARSLAPYRLVACASASYLAERGTPAHPADLAGHECLGFAYWSSALGRRWRFTRDGRSFEVEIGGRLQVKDGRALLHAALAGFGVALGAEVAVREDLATGRLVRVLPDYDGPSRPMHLIFAADQRPTSKLRHFIDAVVGEFGRPR